MGVPDRFGHFRGFGASDFDFTFRPENHVRLSQHPNFFTDSGVLADSASQPWQGLYTIGDVLPVGLSEEEANAVIYHNYVDIDCIGCGSESPPPLLVYGPAGRPFDNRWDLVDAADLTWASSAKLIYDARTGEVVLDTTGPDGGHIANFRLQSDLPGFDASAYGDVPPIPGAFEPPRSMTR